MTSSSHCEHGTLYLPCVTFSSLLQLHKTWYWRTKREGIGFLHIYTNRWFDSYWPPTSGFIILIATIVIATTVRMSSCSYLAEYSWSLVSDEADEIIWHHLMFYSMCVIIFSPFTFHKSEKWMHSLLYCCVLRKCSKKKRKETNKKQITCFVLSILCCAQK